MTHKRPRHYLLAAILCFAICLWALSARASDWSWMAQGGVKINFAGSMGYDTGYGIEGQAGVRWRFLETRLSGDWMAQHKKTATSGNHYNAALELRAYGYGPLYVVGAYERAGYWSHFESDDPDAWAKAGTTWSKHGHHWITGIGFNNKDTEVALKYWWREHDSPNETDAIGVKIQQRVWQGLFVTGECNYSTWLQGDERLDGVVLALGLVWRFE